jgi:hypothetical protein
MCQECDVTCRVRKIWVLNWILDGFTRGTMITTSQRYMWHHTDICSKHATTNQYTPMWNSCYSFSGEMKWFGMKERKLWFRIHGLWDWVLIQNSFPIEAWKHIYIPACMFDVNTLVTAWILLLAKLAALWSWGSQSCLAESLTHVTWVARLACLSLTLVQCLLHSALSVWMKLKFNGRADVQMTANTNQNHVNRYCKKIVNTNMLKYWININMMLTFTLKLL